MVNTNRNLKLLAGVTAALLVLSIAGNIYYWDKSRGLSAEKNKVEQKVNTLLQGQSRDINNLNEQINVAQKKNKSLNGKVQELNGLLSQANTDLWELRTRKTDIANNLAYLRSSKQAQLSDMESKASQLAADKELLAEQNTQLNKKLAGLTDSLQTMVDNALTADGFRMVALKRNNKETAKAKKVHVLTVSFTVPAALGISGREEVYLSLTDSQGNALNSPVRTIQLSIPEQNREIPVHDVESIHFNKGRQAVTFTVQRTDNIEPGMYRASVYTKDKYLGSVECQFRDSFWFF